MTAGALTLAAYLHDLDPFAIRLTDTFGLRWYGLAYLAGFVAAWVWMRALAKRGLIRVPADAVADVILALVIGVMVGGRLGYALFYRPDLFMDFRSSFPFWGLLDIMHGGMASHGGIVGIIVACWWMARGFRVPTLHVMDVVASVAGVGIVLGRLANFVNGELLGKIAASPGEPAPWWSVKYPQELLERWDSSGRTVEQTIEVETMLVREAREGENPLSSAVIERLIGLVQRGDEAVREQLAPLLSARHPTQLYQAFAEGLLTLAVVWWVWRRPRRPGVIAATFMIVYAVGRVATELVRLPDAHLEVARWLGMSRGQWLSVALAAAGLTILWWASRSKAERLGGWATPRGDRDAGPVEPDPAGSESTG